MYHANMKRTAQSRKELCSHVKNAQSWKEGQMYTSHEKYSVKVKYNEATKSTSRMKSSGKVLHERNSDIMTKCRAIMTLLNSATKHEKYCIIMKSTE